jgi:tetratricopeptide (TPR) repeat protein
VVSELFSTNNAIGWTIQGGALAAAETELRAVRQRLESVHTPGQIEGQCRFLEAFLLRYRGQVTQAIELLRSAQAERRAVGDLQILSFAGNQLADALFEVGEPEEAKLALREAVSIGDQGIGYGGVAPRCSLLVHHVRQGEMEEARRLLSEAREKAVELGSRAADLHMLSWAEAHLAVAQGRWREAMAAFEAAADGAARCGTRWLRARLLQEWAEAHLLRGALGDRERARELLREGKAEFEAMGVPIYAAQLAERLEQIEDHP